MSLLKVALRTAGTEYILEVGWGESLALVIILNINMTFFPACNYIIPI